MVVMRMKAVMIGQHRQTGPVVVSMPGTYKLGGYGPNRQQSLSQDSNELEAEKVAQFEEDLATRVQVRKICPVQVR